MRGTGSCGIETHQGISLRCRGKAVDRAKGSVSSHQSHRRIYPHLGAEARAQGQKDRGEAFHRS
jgi:hypothetical protein